MRDKAVETGPWSIAASLVHSRGWPAFRTDGGPDPVYFARAKFKKEVDQCDQRTGRRWIALPPEPRHPVPYRL